MLTAERLRKLLDYDQENGIFKWRIGRKSKSGDGRGLWKLKRDVGTYSVKGYLTIEIDGCSYQYHRLVWLYVHGEWPKNQIDHVNGIRDDNRIANLREATAFENQRNAKVKKTNKIGLKGVSMRGKRFVVRIHVGDKRLHLGSFKTAEEASVVYEEAAKKYYGEFARFS